jgi:hypothetical protein
MLRELHNEELHEYYFSSSIIMAMRLERYVARMGEIRHGYKILVGICDWKKAL